MAVALLEDRSRKIGHVESEMPVGLSSGIPAHLDSSGLRTKEDEGAAGGES